MGCLFDWLWMRWHHICTKHRAPLLEGCGPGGLFYWCPQCRAEDDARFNARLKELGVM